MEKELLKDTDLSMDGSAFEKDTGFKSVPPNSSREQTLTRNADTHTRS
jgi:hypothetical protein